MKKYFPIVIVFIVILLCSTIILALRLRAMRSLNQGLSKDKKELQGYVILSGKHTFMGYNNTIEIWDNHGNKSTIENIIRDKTLVLRIPRHSCNLCIDLALSDLKQYFGAIKSRVIILRADSTTRGIKMFQNKYGRKFKVYGSKPNAFQSKLGGCKINCVIN